MQAIIDAVPTATQRFWKYVQAGGPEQCWEWKGSRDGPGYGRLSSVPGCAPFKAHRLSWWIHTGYMPKSHEHVLHRCDNPPCVNPGHLFLGNPGTNATDRTNKGRARPGWVSGEMNGEAKLTEQQVLEIRRKATEGMTQKAIGAEYGVAQSQVWRIIHRVQLEAHLMPSFSRTTIIGHVGQSPELRYSASGKAMANFSVAVSDGKKLPDGKWEDGTQWWRVQMFGEMAERMCGDYEGGGPRLPKGAAVLAEGRAKVNLWKDKQGETRADLELFANVVQGLERKPKEDGQSGFAPRPQQQASRPSVKEAFADLPFE